MALGGYNRNGAAGTLRDMQAAARPASADDDLTRRVDDHDHVLAAHGEILADHGDRLDRLESHGDGGGDQDGDGG